MSIEKHIYDPVIRQQLQLTLDAIYACNIIKKLSDSDRHLETYRLLFSKLNNSNNSNRSHIILKIQELTRSLAYIDEILDSCNEIVNL